MSNVELTYVRTGEVHTLDPDAVVQKTMCGFFVGQTDWHSPAPDDTPCSECRVVETMLGDCRLRNEGRKS